MTKPNCYDCKYREGVPGDADAHSCCRHPVNKDIFKDPILQIMGTLASVGRTVPMQVNMGLNIKGDAHGIKNNWFNWPVNFDPIWLKECNGFTKYGATK